MRWSVADRHYPSKLVNFRSASTAAFIKSEIPKWAKVIKDANIKVD